MDRADPLAADLAADVAHVGVDRAGAGAVGVAPDLDEELLAGADHARAGGEEGEEVELGGGEVHLLAGHPHPAAVEVELEVADRQEPLARPPPASPAATARSRSTRRRMARIRATSSRGLKGLVR